MISIIVTILVLLVVLVIYVQMDIVKNKKNTLKYNPFDYEDSEINTWTMHVVHFKNRYNQPIYFVQISINEIQMTFESINYTTSTEHNLDNNEVITMISLPGGPIVFVGMNLGFIDTVWQDCIIIKISKEEKIIIIKYQTKETND